MTARPVLEVQHLRKAFGSFLAVDDVSFTLDRGEILGLLGPNGAGKTTTLQMLLGLITPTSGTIRIFGMAFAPYREAILQRVNFSSTYVSLPYTLSVRENLDVFARLYGVKPRVSRVEAVLELLNLQDLANRPTKQLSSGQLTRLHLAKALLNEPELLFLDEPTASLDPDTADQIRQLLKGLRAEHQLSILYTSHNMAEMQEMSDRVVFLSRGRVLATGTPDELIARFQAEDLEELFLKIARGQLKG
jgi:ABC-2 type transport system ATP-binding protein